MKELKRITAFVLVLVMLAGSFAFAAETSIISPAENAVITSDSLLISVKFTDVTQASITLYEQQIKEVAVKTTGSAVNGTLATYSAVTYKKIDTTDYDEDKLASVSAIKGVVSTLYMAPQIYTGTEAIGFYTKQLTSVKPGVYKLVVKTMDEKGRVIETQSSVIAVKEKPQEDTGVFEKSSSSPTKFLQNLLKSIFG